MIKRIFSLNASLLIILMLIGVLFGFIPRSHAQTVQDWSEPINLSGSGAGSNPSMVIDSHGVLHVLWVDKFEGYKYTESPDGLTWSSPVTVKFPFSLEQILPPVFLADPKGVIHIFWLSEKNDLFYAQTLDENLAIPTGWRMVSKRDSSVFDFDLDIDAQGRLHLGYVKNPIPVADSRGIVVPLPATSKAGVFYQLSNDGGTRWTTPGLLYESPYFRSLTSQNARIRIAASPTGDGAKVYAVWDDQAQKRIFMATSVDGGLNWSSARELISPQATLGFKTPYHADIDVLQDKVLVTWQIGDPGVQCTPYSWVSSNGGESWEEPVKILDEIAGCPEKSEFLPIDPNYSVILLTLQDDLSISAWNNIQWSHPEIQLGPSSITNPATFDTVSLGCEQAQAYQNQLFVVGCDQGPGGDIWFMSRQLQPLETLFPLPSAWGKDANVATATETMTSLVSVADAANNVHVLWIQSSSSLTDPVDPRIEYSRWNGKEWTKASPVITDLPGLPLNLTVQIDTQQRLLLSWIDQPTGELLFSWASSERANVPVEWIKPVVMTSSSQVTNSPDMLVDASDRIMLAYAITVNEDRGVYVIQSGDLGLTWSPPVRVFDAMSANWEMVDQPQLAVTQDGKLHILFTQYTLLGSQQAVGLNYSQSMDGGLTWTAPLMVNQHPVEWSEILAFKQTLHRFWQEKDQAGISTYQQVSVDGGLTWTPSTVLPSTAGIVSKPEVFLDWSGNVHLLQMAKDNVHILQEWDWSNERSQLIESRKLGLPKENPEVTIESGVTSQGIIYALIQSKKPLSIDGMETSILSISRSLELTEAPQPFLASVSTPLMDSLSTPDPAIQLTPTVSALMVPVDDTRSRIFKNIVGLVLIVALVVLMLFLTIPKRDKATTKIRQSK